MLAARDPAAHVSLDDLYAISGLLREAGAHQQATALADRAAAHVALDDPSAVASLLRQLRGQTRASRSPCWPPVIQPPTSPSTTCTPSPAC